MNRSLSVIVPVYNEAATVREALAAIVGKAVPGWDLQIVIIESNSPDGSRDAVLEYRDHPRVTLILEDAPGGKGRAVRKGLARATGEFVLIQDADLEYDLADYERLLEPLAAGTVRFVLGARRVHEKGAMRTYDDQPAHAVILNLAHKFFAFSLNTALGLSLRDPFTMYKVFRRDCLDGLTLECDRFDFDWEILIKLVRKGHIPVEIPVSYHSRSFKEGKKIRLFRDPLTWMVALVRYRLCRL